MPLAGLFLSLDAPSWYVHEFARIEGVEVRGLQRPMQTATSADGITIVNFGIGSPNAATVCDLLSALRPEAALFLGKCGGLKEVVRVGEFILPIAAVRAEGTSDSYYPKEIPALPSFQLQKAVILQPSRNCAVLLTSPRATAT